MFLRRVAQFGRALRSGRRGRKFESCRDDFHKKVLGGFCLLSVIVMEK